MQCKDSNQLPGVPAKTPNEPVSEAPLDLDALLENFGFPFATADVLFAALPPFRSEKR
jgi:hypothetical protein